MDRDERIRCLVGHALNDHYLDDFERNESIGNHILANLKEAGFLADERAALTSPAPAGGEADGLQCNIKAIARVISLSYGEDPDEDAPLTRICTADNRPLPCWEAYREQANALMIWFSAVIDRLSPPPSPDVAGVAKLLLDARSVLNEPFHHGTIADVLVEAATLLESLSAEKGRLVNLVKDLDDALCAAQEKLQGNPLVLKWVIEIIGDARARARTALTPKEKA